MAILETILTVVTAVTGAAAAAIPVGIHLTEPTDHPNRSEDWVDNHEPEGGNDTPYGDIPTNGDSNTY